MRRVALVVVAVVVVLLIVWVVVNRGNDAPTNTAATAPTSSAPMTGELATPSVTGSPADPTSSFPDASSATGTSSDATSAATVPSDAPSDPGTAGTTSAAVTEVPTTVDPAAQAAAASAAAQAAAEQSAAAASQAAAEAQAAADAQAAAAAAEAARPRDAEGRLLCPDASVQLTATVGSPTYNVGQQPIVGVTVVNTGSEPCVRDVSGSVQEYLAYDAAGTRLWSTSDCVPGSGTDVRLLQPGESLQYNIKWSGTTSQPGCAAERTRVPAGDYRIEARIGSLVSSQATLTFR